jgi:hypothetical protein
MDDGTRKPAGAGRWILLGCAVVGGLGVLGFAGSAGLFYYIYRSTGDIAAVGGVYLQQASEVRSALGDDVSASRSWSGSRVHVTPSGGTAYFTYDLKGSKGSGQAEVWLDKKAGAWTATGARVRRPGVPDDLPVGTVPPVRAFGRD